MPLALPFGNGPVETIAADSIPTALAPDTVIPMPNGIGHYYLFRVNLARKVGLLAATFAPEIHDFSPIDNWNLASQPSPPVPAGSVIANAGLILALLNAKTGNAILRFNPDVFGDTWRYSITIQRFALPS